MPAYYSPAHFEECPGICLYLIQDNSLWEAGVLSVEHHATTVCVTKPAAMEISFPPMEASPGVISLDIEQTVPKGAEMAAAADAEEAEEVIAVRPAPASCAYNKDALTRARAKARAGAQLKWLAYGDSVTVPVQLWNMPEKLQRSKYAYYAVAAAEIEKEFGCRISVEVNAVGGRQLNEDFDSLLSSLSSAKPDVLVMLAGDTVENYRVLLPQVVDAAAASGTEICVVIPTYAPSPLRRGEFDWLRRWCVENGVACCDARTYLLAVPEYAWGDVTANPSHPNPLGHRLIGQAVAEMFR